MAWGLGKGDKMSKTLDTSDSNRARGVFIEELEENGEVVSRQLNDVFCG